MSTGELRRAGRRGPARWRPARLLVLLPLSFCVTSTRPPWAACFSTLLSRLPSVCSRASASSHADDFIVKPFGVKEVVARIRAVTRRCRLERAVEEPFMMHDLQVLPAQLRACRGGVTIELSLRDVQLLRLFHRRAGEVLDRRTIFAACWGEEYLPSSRTLDQHISQLRKRIEADPRDPRLIRTVHGAGYRYQPQ